MKQKLPKQATSKRWCELLNINPKDILDPDGWDRGDNFWYDFNQKLISKLMFDNKISASTCSGTAFEYCRKLTKDEIEKYRENKNDSKRD